MSNLSFPPSWKCHACHVFVTWLWCIEELFVVISWDVLIMMVQPASSSREEPHDTKSDDVSWFQLLEPTLASSVSVDYVTCFCFHVNFQLQSGTETGWFQYFFSIAVWIGYNGNPLFISHTFWTDGLPYRNSFCRENSKRRHKSLLVSLQCTLYLSWSWKCVFLLFFFTLICGLLENSLLLKGKFYFVPVELGLYFRQ